MFPTSISHALEPFSLIHCNVWGPYRTPSSSGASYFLTIVDDCSRGVWIFLMKNKSEVAILIPQFRTFVLNQFHKSLRCVRSDNGTKFTSLRPFCESLGLPLRRHVLGPHNKTGGLRENTDIFSTLLGLFVFKVIYQLIFGVNVSLLLHTLLIELLHHFYHLKHPMKFFFINHLHKIT